MQNKDFNDAMNSYYKLKESYEDKYNQAKMKIIRNKALSSKEKQQKFKQVKKQCIYCKKDGGSIFTNEDNKLRVVCGHIQKPCRLNIELDKGLYINSEDLADDLNQAINEKKTEMIKLKLDFLFGYITEEDALERFNHVKEEIQRKNDSYRKVEVFYLNIVDNKYKKDLLEDAKRNLYISIQKIKELNEVYSISENKLLLKNAVEIYINEVLPLVSSISDLEYVYRAVEKQIKDGNSEKKLDWMQRFSQPELQNVLIEKAYTLNELEYPLKESKIIFNKK